MAAKTTDIATPLNAEALHATVFISDNLPLLRALDTESIDLVCIDPPFGKNQAFTGSLRPPLTDKEQRIERELLESWGVNDSDSAYELGLEYPDQTGMTASFSDIWNFQVRVTKEWLDALKGVNPAAYWLIQSARYSHGNSHAAYIAFMVERMIEIHRILKPTGSVYLHCDYEANAYLRQMMDAVFGNGEGGSPGFRNEIVWRRSPGRSTGKHWGNTTESIFYYSKSRNYTWNDTYRPSDNTNQTRVPLDAAGVRYGKSGQAWQGYNPTDIGRHWAVPKIGQLAQWIERNQIPDYSGIEDPHMRLDALEEAGLIAWSDNGRPAILRPPEADVGAKVNNLWTDITLLSPRAVERTGYPTQKPQALARRIMEASSNPGDIVLDCFAGCAYVPVAAEFTGRRWIACDMSPRAWTVIRRQFHKHPDLGIVTEGEVLDESIKTRLENAGRVIRVRGPHDLPVRTTVDAPVAMAFGALPDPVFKQTPHESSEQIWQAFVEEWGTRCWYCGTDKPANRRELQLDHIEPNKRDGTNDDCFNRALSCAPCNGDKSDRLTPEETINLALETGRIATPRLRDEVQAGFTERHQWAKDRWERIKPNRMDLERK